MQAWRLAFAVISCFFVGGVIVQVFLAGAGLFGATDMRAHAGFGWNLAAVPILIGLLAIPARPGMRTGWLCLALVLTGALQPLLPGLASISPALAALHPPNALLAFWLGITIARRATDLAFASGPSSPDDPLGGESRFDEGPRVED